MLKSENNLIAWISERFALPPDADDSLMIGIGDDMAMIRSNREGLLIASDMLMDGVDFDVAVHAPQRIGRKALAVNLSDCAAMAVRPRYALISLALPGDWSMEQAQGLYLGMEALARRYDVRLIGGDTNSWMKSLVIDVTVLAEPWASVRPITRNGARPGDHICVSGPLGGSLAGHHLDFEPRVLEAKQLAESYGERLHAMMDISDGLSIDAMRMSKASGIGIELFEESLEQAASTAARQAAAHDGRSVLDHVLHDGEDFELLFTIDSARAGVSCDHASQRIIGRAVDERGVWLLNREGKRVPVQPLGWQHFT